eukprot:1158548-Pelagomonas_calceolata.AAC.2
MELAFLQGTLPLWVLLSASTKEVAPLYMHNAAQTTLPSDGARDARAGILHACAPAVRFERQYVALGTWTSHLHDLVRDVSAFAGTFCIDLLWGLSVLAGTFA